MMWLIAQASGDPLIEWISRAGTVGILAMGVVAFLRGWIVSGSQHQRVIDEKNRALDLVYKQAELAQRALDVAERRGS
jgi:hypothetical protein